MNDFSSILYLRGRGSASEPSKCWKASTLIFSSSLVACCCLAAVCRRFRYNSVLCSFLMPFTFAVWVCSLSLCLCSNDHFYNIFCCCCYNCYCCSCFSLYPPSLVMWRHFHSIDSVLLLYFSRTYTNTCFPCFFLLLCHNNKFNDTHTKKLDQFVRNERRTHRRMRIERLYNSLHH